MARRASETGDGGTNALIVSDVIRRNELQAGSSGARTEELLKTNATTMRAESGAETHQPKIGIRSWSRGL